MVLILGGIVHPILTSVYSEGGIAMKIQLNEGGRTYKMNLRHIGSLLCMEL